MSKKTPFEQGEAARHFDEALKRAKVKQSDKPAVSTLKPEPPLVDPRIAMQLQSQGVDLTKK